MNDESIGSKLENLVFANRLLFFYGLLGLLFVGVGLFLYKSELLGSKTKVEVLGSFDAQVPNQAKVTVEIAGAIVKPGVYELLASDRVERLLIASGGLSANADREWISKNLNKAAKLVDGQKIYVPKEGEQELAPIKSGSGRSGRLGEAININNASVAELDALSGIGAVRAQKIIDNRPFSSVEELLAKKILPKDVYEKIKDKVVAP